MLLYSLYKEKIISKERAQKFANELKSSNKKIVFTNGCFDLIHPGHIDYLCKARDLGDFLIVGLNTDTSVKKLDKGINRPINNETSRAFVMAGLMAVDAIVLFDEETPIDLIKLIQPNVLVKGDDYAVEKIVGYDFVKSIDGEIITIPFLQGFSTTKIIERIKAK